MDEKPKSRAAAMAAQYGDKLKSMGAIKPESALHETSNKETPEQIAKLKKAVQKLHTFKDLI